MKRAFLYGLAITVAFSLELQTAWAQKTRQLRTISVSYYQTATIEPTTARIKSLKLPAGFTIAKFVEITKPRILAVASDGTVYVSQREPGTVSMLKDTNGAGAAGYEDSGTSEIFYRGRGIEKRLENRRRFRKIE
jgi:hypothetical protein